MNKLNILFLGTLIGLGMVACDDKLPVAPPQANEQGPVLEGFEGATASLLETSIALPTTVEDAGATVKMYSINAGASGLEQSSLWGELEISNSVDFTESVILSQVADQVGTVQLSDLCDAHKQLFGVSPNAKTVYYRVLLYALVDGNNYRIGSYDTYGATGTYSETYDPGFEIDDVYYIIGIEGWDPGSEVMMSHPADVSAYDDPTFTYSFTCEENAYWKIVTPEVHAQVGDPAFDAGTMFWPLLYAGIPKEDDEFNGTLVQEDIDAPYVPAGEWTITINMKDFTYSVSGTPTISSGAPAGIYLRGSWSESWDALPAYQFSATAIEGQYVVPFVTLNAGAEFKVADMNWSDINLGGPAGGVIKVGEEYALEGGENIKLEEDFTGYATLTKKDDAYTLLLSTYEAGTAGSETGVYIRGGMNEWNVVAEYEFKTSQYKDIMVFENLEIGEGVEFKIADEYWGDINYGYGSVDLAKVQNFGMVQGGDNISFTTAFKGEIMFIHLYDMYWFEAVPAE